MFRTKRPWLLIAVVLCLSAFDLADTAAAHASAPPAVGLVSWWPADGSALDVAGGNVGTPHDGVTYAPGMLGQAFSFNGKRAGIGVRDADNLKITGSLSISAWILVASFPASGSSGNIIFRGDGRGALDPYALDTQPNGTLQFHLESLTKGVNLYAPVPKGQFVHVAATFDAGTGLMRIYVNGALAAPTTTDVTPFRDLDPKRNPGVGLGNHSGLPEPPHNYPFHGLIDELQLYNRALSASEVRILHDAGLGHQKAAAVEIDVAPGSPRHVIDLGNDTIRVVILSAPWLNAPREVDPRSLTFGAIGSEQSLILSQLYEQDVNGDGLPDLVCEFRTDLSGLHPKSTEAVLEGATTDGGAIVGANAILPAQQGLPSPSDPNALVYDLHSGNANIGQLDPLVWAQGHDAPVGGARDTGLPLEQAFVVPNQQGWASVEGAQWVSSARSGNDVPGGYEYSVPFALPPGFKSAHLDILWRGDDQAALYVNDRRLPPDWGFFGADRPPAEFHGEIMPYLQPGMNELQFLVSNAYVGINPTGVSFWALITLSR